MNSFLKQKIKNIFLKFGYEIVGKEYLSQLKTPYKSFYSLIEQLRSHIDLTKIETYRSCNYVNNFELFFESYSDINVKPFIRFCCSALEYIPRSDDCKTLQETANKIIKTHNNIIAESKMFSLLSGTPSYEIGQFTSSCSKCNLFQMKDWGKTDGQIHKICFNMHPSPCQCRCIYCSNYGADKTGTKKILNEMLKYPYKYEKVFDIIEYLKKNNMIANNVVWHIASGEITIHPFRERIFNLIENQTSHFSTNCFIYDKNIAMNLGLNPKSFINLSIDSGTSETWKKVKRVNNFNNVLENLYKYSSNCINPEQITLKYIILPGLNDNLKDYLSIIEIMKSLNIINIGIECDIHERYKRNEEQSKALIKATGHFLAILKKNNLSYQFSYSLFTSYEIESSICLANELLETGS